MRLQKKIYNATRFYWASLKSEKMQSYFIDAAAVIEFGNNIIWNMYQNQNNFKIVD